MYYADYLGLDKILSAQKTVSQVHDETLFIITHQSYELWFKQILHEVDSVRGLLEQPKLADSELSLVATRLDRTVRIQRLLLSQFEVLETMTPMDFLEFREFLFPASGFQSVQFRVLENKMGLNRTAAQLLERLKPADREQILNAAGEASLFELIDRWLERLPFLETNGFNFQEDYRKAVERMLITEREKVAKSPSFDEQQRKAETQKLAGTEKHFEALLDEKKYSQTKRLLSYRATQAALFILLYRQHPVFHLPYRILASLTDVDEQMTAWRHQHALLARRMLGTKIGTGGSSGYEYLRRVAETSTAFHELTELVTFLLPRSTLPDLPPELEKKLGFTYGA